MSSLAEYTAPNAPTVADAANLSLGPLRSSLPQRWAPFVAAILVVTAGCSTAKDIARQVVQPFAELAAGLAVWTTTIPGHLIREGALYKAVAGRGSMPIHGNWCGPNYPRAGANPPPVDDVDAACMRHDLCYLEKGDFACECDQRLVEEVLAGRDVRVASFSKIEAAIITWFAHSSCKGCKHFKSSDGANYVKVCG